MRTRTAIAALITAVVALTGTLPASAATKNYTLAQVKQHKKSSNCWAAINGNVYNLTSWINKHPGGPSVITALCGRDASKAFAAHPGGTATPKSMLAGFKVGKLKK